jgi:hypothetical protein
MRLIDVGRRAPTERVPRAGPAQQRPQFDAQLFLRQRRLAPQVDSLRAGDIQKLRVLFRQVFLRGYRAIFV